MEKNSKWQIFERVSKIIQVIVLIAGTFSLVGIYHEIKHARREADKTSLDFLWKIDLKLNEGKNKIIRSAIIKNKPIVNKKITNDDLNSYINDLFKIPDAYERKLIDLADVWAWFHDDIVFAHDNAEIKARIGEPDHFSDFDELYKKMIVMDNVK